jgi:hypothetical protein
MREEKLVRLHCNSVFAPYIEEFIGQKRALGNKYNAATEVLNLFDDFCVQQDIQELALSELLYQKWSLKRPSESGNLVFYTIFFQTIKNSTEPIDVGFTIILVFNERDNCFRQLSYRHCFCI